MVEPKELPRAWKFKKIRLWCLNPTWRERPTHVWTEHYEKMQAKQPRTSAAAKAAAETVVTDQDLPF